MKSLIKYSPALFIVGFVPATYLKSEKTSSLGRRKDETFTDLFKNGLRDFELLFDLYSPEPGTNC